MSNIKEIRSKGITLCTTKCYECSDIDCPSHPINLQKYGGTLKIQSAIRITVNQD